MGSDLCTQNTDIEQPVDKMIKSKALSVILEMDKFVCLNEHLKHT